RHTRLRVRACAPGHPDAERVGAGREARDDCDLAPRVPVRARPIRRAPARGQHGIRLWTGCRRARATHAGAVAVGRDRRARPDDHGLPRLAALPRRLPLREVPFDQILDEVKSGRADAGLLIHEGQLTYEAKGLRKAVDLGEWWLLETGLPLPLGINVARRDLGPEVLHDLSEVLRESIVAGLDNRSTAMEYALGFGRGLDVEIADRFVGMYVNEFTCDYGEEGRAAAAELLRRGGGLGALAPRVELDLVCYER